MVSDAERAALERLAHEVDLWADDEENALSDLPDPLVDAISTAVRLARRALDLQERLGLVAHECAQAEAAEDQHAARIAELEALLAAMQAGILANARVVAHERATLEAIHAEGLRLREARITLLEGLLGQVWRGGYGHRQLSNAIEAVLSPAGRRTGGG
jgi:hypothetical protein